MELTIQPYPKAVETCSGFRTDVRRMWLSVVQKAPSAQPYKTLAITKCSYLFAKGIVKCTKASSSCEDWKTSEEETVGQLRTKPMVVRVNIVARPMNIRSWDDFNAEIPWVSQFSTCVTKWLKLVSNFQNFCLPSEKRARVDYWGKNKNVGKKIEQDDSFPECGKPYFFIEKEDVGWFWKILTR